MSLQRIARVFTLFCLCLCFVATRAGAIGPEDWAIGKTVPDVYGYDQNGNLVQLRDLAGKNVIFEVSAAWCYPSYVLAANANTAKAYLDQHGVPFEYITVIAQDPRGGNMPLRSQGLAWQKEFGTTTPILSFFNGPNIDGKIVLNAGSQWLLRAAGNAFPALAIIGPDQVIKKVQTGALSVDEIIAEFLPDQPGIPETPIPPAAVAVKRATVTVQIDKKSSSSVDPFVDDSSGTFPVSPFQKGKLPSDYSVAIGTKRVPQQEIWSVYFQGHVNPFDGDPGFPTDKPITISLSSIQWDRTRKPGTLASPVAKIQLNDNIQTDYSPEIDVPVIVRGGRVIVGPFTLEKVAPLYPFRIMTVRIVWLAQQSSLGAAFLGDYLTLQFDIPQETRDSWIEQLRQIEESAKTPGNARKKTFASIDKLTRSISRYKGEGLTSEGRRYLLRGLSRVRATMRDGKEINSHPIVAQASCQ